MGKYRNSRVVTFLYWIAVLSLAGSALASFAQTDCAKSPTAAVELFRSSSPKPVHESGSGYRVTGIRWDPLLRQNWARVANCEHPERPEVSLRMEAMKAVSGHLIGRTGPEISPFVAVVHAGDVVRLWRREDLLRIEVTGVAEESGGVGKKIRVRLLRRNTDDQSKEEQFTGIIRGPLDVEMLP
jgi:hypothetical protein